MRFLKILGMVVALHVVLFTIFLLSPGCQSNPTTPAPVPAASTEPADSSSTLAATPVDEQENWTSPRAATSTRTPAPAGSNSVSSTISSAPLPGMAADGGRSAPARPSNPESYVSTGDTPPPALNPPPTTHIVRAGDSFAKIAARYGTTATAVQRANPGVKPQSLRVGQEIKLPANITAGASAGGSASAPASAAGARYTVRAGDSLSAIAARNGTTVTALRQANNLRSDTIQIGQELTIPGGASGSASAVRASSAAPAPARRAANTISGDASTATFEHTLRSGETLGALAKRYGVSTESIIEANNISDPRKIRAGQKLTIPGQGGRQTSAPAAATTAPAPSAPATQPETTPAPAGDPLPPADSLPPPEPLVPADMTDAPPIPVDEPVPTP